MTPRFRTDPICGHRANSRTGRCDDWYCHTPAPHTADNPDDYTEGCRYCGIGTLVVRPQWTHTLTSEWATCNNPQCGSGRWRRVVPA